MTANELRQKYLKFFEKKGHKIIPSVSLVPSQTTELSGTQKVLFTTAGMHPLIPYLLGEEHHLGKRLVNVQKCLRTDDIDEVGNATHGTFFEMLGNWSLGDYWKKEAIEYSFEFLTKELGIPIEKLAVSVFEGDDNALADEESAEIWRSLGILERRIARLPKKDNWWGPVGDTGPCGSDTEMFYWTGDEPIPEKFDPTDNRWVEIWNDVFMEYNKTADGKYEPLKQKNVDTGMGLERTLMVLQGKTDIYQTDIFTTAVGFLSSIGISDIKAQRIVADHIRAAVFLILDGVTPSNKFQGYVLRRLLRRAAVKVYQATNKLNADDFEKMAEVILGVFDGLYGISKDKDLHKVSLILRDEIERFEKTLSRGLKEVEKIDKIDGKIAFDLYQTFGFPYEVTEELFRQKGQEINREQFKAEFEKHRELSRTASAGMFKGGLADHSEVVIKYHTVTHLLHQALRDVLGPQVFQQGSNITAERLRFDFSFERKMSDEEIKQVEDLVNQKIKEDLKVDRKFMSVEEAKNLGAIGLFDEKYTEQVSIYMIGPNYTLDAEARDQRDRSGYYSMEFCGGPHVEHTGVIGRVIITKEEAISAGIRRIRAELV